jgi:nucleoside-diphosphate-sugar epimerase
MICGTAARPGPISEDESPSPTANHLVPYTSSKARAELALQRALPAARRLVVRPSIVMGDSRPLVPRSPAILWAMAALNRLRLLPVDADAALDIVSVDYAADAICALLFAGASGVYHVSSGPGGATSARRLAATLARHFGGPPFCFVSASLFPSIQRWAKGQAPEEGGELRAYGRYLNYWRDSFCDARRLRAVLAALEPYLRFMELGHVFDNRRLLAATELRTPPPAHIYMEPAMRYLTTIDIVGEAADP